VRLGHEPEMYWCYPEEEAPPSAKPAHECSINKSKEFVQLLS